MRRSLGFRAEFETITHASCPTFPFHSTLPTHYFYTMAKDEEKKAKKRKSIVPGEEAAAEAGPISYACFPFRSPPSLLFCTSSCIANHILVHSLRNLPRYQPTPKKSKKDKKDKTADAAGDVSMADADVSVVAAEGGESSKKEKKEKDEFHVPIDAIAPIAAPLAGKKLSKKLFKTVKKGPSPSLL